MVLATAFVHPSAIKADATVLWSRVEWQPPDTTAAGPEARQQEIVEVIVCRCSRESEHSPPSGKTGCGYWNYLHLQKGAIRDGD
jgi:hypothetical protein